jgi:predicted transcriptional regulator
MDRSPKEPDYLGPLERRVMARLWTDGQQTVAQIMNALNDGSRRQLAYTTVMTILVRLTDKGYVYRKPKGRQFLYTAAMDEATLAATVGRRELGRLIERYGAASLAAFAQDLTSDSDLVRRLRRLAEADRE